MKVDAISYQDLTGTHAHHASRTYSEPEPYDLFALFAARPDWMADAACRGKRTQDWYPSQGDSRIASTVNAKAICRGCPVQADCLEYALNSHPAEMGIWAGLSEKQRKLIRLRDPDRYALDRRQHGTVSRYNDGCRCVACKRANAEFRARSRTRSKRNRLRQGAA